MISVIMPAYNEEDVIQDSLAKLLEVKFPEKAEIVVVDDGSKDKTPLILEKLRKKYKNLRVITHKDNKGFGGAIATGINAAEGRIIVTMDADLTHPPKLINEMVKKIDEGYDVCIGSRYVKGGGMENVPFWRVALSFFTNLAFSILFLTRVRDLTGGFKGYKSEFVKKVKIRRKDFSVQMEIIVSLMKRKVKIAEIPLMLKNREKGVSKFNFAKNAPKYIGAVAELFVYRWFG